MEVTGMRNRSIFTISTIALALCSSMALAQEDETGFFAKADTTLAHDDNIYRVTDDLAQSDTYLSIAPELKFIGGFGKQRFEFSYTGDYSKFADASDADYTDHDVRAKIRLDHTLKLSTQFEAGYQKEHEEPGYINRIQLNITEYNKFNQQYILAGAAYGRENAVGRFAINYRKTKKDYTNNNLDFFDFSSDQVSGRFIYRLAPKTRIYAEVVYADVDYDPGNNFELDNIFKSYRAGLSWDISNKLTGDVNIGYQDRNYALETIQDIDGLYYDGEINWSLNTYTQLALNAKRESIDSSIDNAGGFLRTSFNAGLKHSFSELLHLQLFAGYASDDLVFSESRNDKRYSLSTSLDYELSRLVTVGIQYIFDKRESNLDLADFTSNTLGINVNLAWEN